MYIKLSYVFFCTKMNFFMLLFQSSAQQIAVSTDAFVQRAVDELQHRVFVTLENAGLRPESLPNLQEQFSNFELPFNGIQTLHERTNFIIRNYFFVVSIHVHVYICEKTTFLEEFYAKVYNGN